MPRVFIGLGSNLDQPAAQVRRALEALDRLPRTRLVAASPLYRSAPIGPLCQPDYINAVAELETGLAPHDLLASLHSIEAAQGRVRGPERWGPRTLDLDILLYGSLSLDDPRLTVPHPEMLHRAFVLYPLADLAADLVLPNGTGLSRLLQNVSRDGLERLAATDPKIA